MFSNNVLYNEFLSFSAIAISKPSAKYQIQKNNYFLYLVISISVKMPDRFILQIIMKCMGHC